MRQCDVIWDDDSLNNCLKRMKIKSSLFSVSYLDGNCKSIFIIIIADLSHNYDSLTGHSDYRLFSSLPSIYINIQLIFLHRYVIFQHHSISPTFDNTAKKPDYLRNGKKKISHQKWLKKLQIRTPRTNPATNSNSNSTRST